MNADELALILKNRVTVEGRAMAFRRYAVVFTLNQSQQILPSNPRRIAAIFHPVSGNYNVGLEPVTATTMGWSVAANTTPIILNWSTLGIGCQQPIFGFSPSAQTIIFFEVELNP